MTLGTAGLLVVGAKELELEKSPGLMVPSSGALGLYELEGIQLGAASSYRWIRDVLAGVEKELAAEIGKDPMTSWITTCKRAPCRERVVIHAFFIGSGYPFGIRTPGTFAG
jgi:xylulokinase